jgi:hypothetical protein
MSSISASTASSLKDMSYVFPDDDELIVDADEANAESSSDEESVVEIDAVEMGLAEGPKRPLQFMYEGGDLRRCLDIDGNVMFRVDTIVDDGRKGKGRAVNDEPRAAGIPVVIDNEVQEGPAVVEDNDNGWNSKEGWDTSIATVHNTTVTNSWHSPQAHAPAWGEVREVTNAMLEVEIGNISYGMGHFNNDMRAIEKTLKGHGRAIYGMKPNIYSMRKELRKDLKVRFSII